MYINRNIPDNFPFDGVFYTVEIDDSKPLNEQVEEHVSILETECDITEASHSVSSNFISAKYVVYFPLDIDNDTVDVKIGHLFEADMYGVRVNGKVVGVFPSQIGGVTVYIQDIDA